ncbi:MAG: virulence RhuM family protein [Pseudomonadota bacterium]|nr:virulence RhuM family protein [Pseudomonadota bacterium]MDP1572915.1 virulence RhuM family protein [Pseudomonadota bacterium]MDP1906151.1 virulence RhuM family protein [Pseudomonadota bacterium]
MTKPTKRATVAINATVAPPLENEPARGELLLYTAEDGGGQFYLRAEGGTVWLTQLELAELFQSSVPNINIHIRNLLAEGELSAEATIKENLIVRSEGKRTVKRPVKLYNLDLILAVGYRVRSPRGTQFRQWASSHLKEYLIKGFVMDDARLKEPGGWDYFDELLQRIREIRASEKRFYQKVRELFALARDYRDTPETTDLIFAEVQNKLLYAVTGKTAAEIVVDRADPGQPNMALQSWKAGRVRKADVIVAKNYLHAEEVDELNRLVTMFLDYAEDRAKKRQDIALADWRQYTANFLAFNERALLQGAGGIRREVMVRIAHERYEAFDAKRRGEEVRLADAEDIKELEQVGQSMAGKVGKNGS